MSDCSVSFGYEDLDLKFSSPFTATSGAEESSSILLPEKSRPLYEYAYDRFEKWCKEKNMTNEINEEVLLAYFESISKQQKVSSISPTFSMLRAVISEKKNVDIKQYRRLTAFLKETGTGYRPKKKTLRRQDVVKFLTEADDNRFLLMKVALIIGLFGACKCDELINLVVDNVQDHGNFFRIIITNSKTNAPQEVFITAGDIPGINLVEIIRRYVALRPMNTDHRRFFVGFRHGRCLNKPVGMTSFYNMPKEIAAFLKLPYPLDYTGGCFKRSSWLFKH